MRNYDNKEKFQYRPGQSMSSSDRRRIQELESQDVIMARRERHLVAFEHSCMRWCGMALRPLQLVFGIIFFLLAVLIFVSLLLTGLVFHILIYFLYKNLKGNIYIFIY